MKKLFILLGSLSLIGVTLLFIGNRGDKPVPLPPPAVEMTDGDGETKVAVLAGGCFWGIEGVYERLEGVVDVISGYAGGTRETAKYDIVSRGTTGHAEAVQILYDPSRISFGALLEVFFTVAHDPTQLNYQGPDLGSQYRSAIFYSDIEQKQVSEEYIAILTREKVFNKKIVTQVVPLQEFFPAEDYHQDFMCRNPDYPYIVYWDLTKVKHLQQTFPGLVKPEDR